MACHDGTEPEQEPLLSTSNRVLPISVPAPLPHNKNTHSPRIVVVFMVLFSFWMGLGVTMIEVPQLRVMEDIICHRYYETVDQFRLQDNIDESLCKVNEVQNELNIVTGGLLLFTAIPSLLVAMPFGSLVDKIGRKPVLLLSLISLAVQVLLQVMIMWFWRIFPLRLVWLTPVTLCLGGVSGSTIALYTIMSDISTDQNRSNIFSFWMAATYLASFTGPPLASTLMMISPWIPLLIGVGIIGSFPVLALFIPETLHIHTSKISDSPIPDSTCQESTSLETRSGIFSAMKTYIHKGIQEIRDLAAIITLPELLLLITYIETPFGTATGSLLLLYISKQFSWTLAQTGFLASVREFMRCILLVAIIPGGSYLLTRYFHYTPKEKDLFIAFCCAITATVGALLMAISPTVVFEVIAIIMWTLGMGLVPLVRSLISVLVKKEQRGRIFAAIAIVQNGTGLIAIPIMTGLYSLGLKWGGAWLALPFYALAAICVGVDLILWSFALLTKGKLNIGLEEEISTADDI